MEYVTSTLIIVFTCIVYIQLIYTGVMAGICRHGTVEQLMNIIEGERHIYATYGTALYIEAGIPVGFVWYDIGC